MKTITIEEAKLKSILEKYLSEKDVSEVLKACQTSTEDKLIDGRFYQTELSLF